MKQSLLLFAIWLAILIAPCFIWGQALTVTTTPVTITLENAEGGFDLTASGKWIIQFNEDKWQKQVGGYTYTLYPDKSDRSADVIAAMKVVRIKFAHYIAETLENKNYTANKTRGAGLSIASVIKSSFIAVCIEDGVTCELFMRIDNKQHSLKVDIANETPAAIAARNNIVTELAKIAGPASAGSFYK